MYPILSVECSNRGIMYRVRSDRDATPALFSANNFEVVSSASSKTWSIYVSESGELIKLGPKEWASRDFWDNFFENRDTEVETFFRISDIIDSEDK